MNALELADAMQSVISVLNVHHEEDCLFIANDAQYMLRQQHADLEHMWMANAVLEAEIEALKTENSHLKYEISSGAWNPVKALTDEGILEYADAFGMDMGTTYEFGHERFIAVVRAIIKNAESNCNGFCGEYECKENQAICKRKAQE